ncbi:hypothetical protein PYJP_09620 [Pyrofollis japonicus]|uniref:hypothetical protein n=1 Tax=Pyrofollis japonicus TaxID=3060460 RepID=UPI00295BD77F|nr:hypothetical protein [Pyrofollis japonicus]BEP17610.1 hypothetical protein PYJP_09620 [Pyrofollis japonicus]
MYDVIVKILIPPVFIVLHEMLHYAAARLLGLKAYFTIGTDGLLRSPSVFVDDYNVDLFKRSFILYFPYILNILMLFSNDCFIKIFAILTMPNAFLEYEQNRKHGLVVAALVLVVLISIVEKHVANICS